MQKTRPLRYLLFGALFLLIIVGLITHSYPLLVGIAVAAIIIGVIADKIENAPTERYKKYNSMHHHQTHKPS